MNAWSLFIAAALLATPLAGAVAQQSPAPAQPGMATVDKTPSATSNTPYGGPSPTATVPGGTGRTVVPGNNSTVAGDSAGTAKTQTGGGGGGSK